MYDFCSASEEILTYMSNIEWYQAIKEKKMKYMHNSLHVLQMLSDAFGLTHCSWVTHICISKLTIIIPPTQRSWRLYTLLIEVEGGYTGFTLCVSPSVHLCTELCPLCIFYNTCWIHFIFTRLIMQLQQVCCMLISVSKFFKFVTLTLSCSDFRSNMNWSIVWVITGGGGGGGYPQNAVILVVLVFSDNDAILQTPFSNAFSRMKMNEFHIGFHWSLFLRFELTIFQHWFR